MQKAKNNNPLSLELQDSAFGNISVYDECRFAFQENMEMRETDVGLPVAEIKILPNSNFPECTQ